MYRRYYLTNIRKVGKFWDMDSSKSFSEDFYIYSEVGTLFAVFNFSHSFSEECLHISGGERYIGVQMGRMWIHCNQTGNFKQRLCRYSRYTSPSGTASQILFTQELPTSSYGGQWILSGAIAFYTVWQGTWVPSKETVSKGYLNWFRQ